MKNTLWLYTFDIVILIWINQHKKSGSSFKVWFKKTSILVCHILILTFVSMLITMHWSLKSFIKHFGSFWLSFADKVSKGTYNFLSLVVWIILLELTLPLPWQFADKTQWLVHLSLNSTLQLINGLSSDLQKLLRYFQGTVTVVFFKIPFAASASVFPNSLPLYLKELKALFSVLSALKWAV